MKIKNVLKQKNLKVSNLMLQNKKLTKENKEMESYISYLMDKEKHEKQIVKFEELITENVCESEEDDDVEILTLSC